MRIYVSNYTKMIEELKKKLEKERIKISKELFEKANGLNKDINKTILIVENKLVTLNTKTFDEKDENFKKSFINYNGIYIANSLSENQKNQLLDFNKETNKSEMIDIKKIDIKDNPYEKIKEKKLTAKEKATQTTNSTESTLQKLRQELKKLENKVSSLTSKLTSVDDTTARLITVKIAVLNMKITSIKSQIQMILKTKT